MNIQGLLLILASMPNILIGIFVLARNPRDKTNIIFSLFTFSVSAWSIGLAGYLFTTDTAMAMMWAQGYYIAAAIIAALFALFTAFFTTNRTSFTKVQLFAAIPPIALISLLITTPEFIASGVTQQPWGKEVILNPTGYGIYSLYFVSYVGYGFILILRKMLRSKGLMRLNLKFIFAGLFVAFSLGMLFNLVLPFLGNYRYIWAGPLFTIAHVIIISYAMIKHGLFDIRLAAVRTLAYALSLITLAVLYGLFALKISNDFFGFESTTSQNIIYLFLALLLVYVFQPIKRFFDKITNRVFYKDQYETSDFISRLGDVLTSTTDLRTLLNQAATEIGTTLKSDQAFFYIQYAGDKHISAGTKHHTVVSADEYERIKEYTLINGQSVVLTELLENNLELERILRRRSIALLMPITKGKLMLGYLALGEQLGGGYKERDIKALETVAGELLIAIQNSLSAQEVRETNIHLQERIKDATDELTRSNSELKKLDKSKDEFLSLASHQLRTPLTSVKGYLSMVLDEDMGKITPDQDKALRQAYDSAQRMVFLINDFLNVSRLQTGRFELETRAIDIVTMTSEEVSQLTDTAAGKHITLSYTQPAPIVGFFADENKLRQVMMNFIDNAIYYSLPETTVEVKLYEDKGHVIFRVVDNGIGVPESEQAKLFTKFFRATNARRQRPDGTGIGLYMAKKVIIAHGGEMIFESTEGKGSVFGFRLPVQGVPTPGSVK